MGEPTFRSIRKSIVENQQPVPEKDVVMILEKLAEVLISENNLVAVPSPVNIVGDVHGQLDDVIWMFQQCGSFDDSLKACEVDDFTPQNYVFMGDYVDRGYHSMHTFLYLACLKLEFPQVHICLLRGNHESRAVSMRYGLYNEITLSYGHLGLWNMLCDVFNMLPVAALVDKDVFCVHGGLSPELSSIDCISLVDRHREIPQEGLIADLCWSDPENVSGWRKNSRGAGWLFGLKETQTFTWVNRVQFVCRSHQLAQDGYAKFFGDRSESKPRREYRLITVWSAPNYSYRSGNTATVMKYGFDGEEVDKLVKFDVCPEPRINTRDSERTMGTTIYFL